MTDQAAAKKLGVDRRTLFRWRKLPGFPGTDDMKKLRAWVKENKGKRREPEIRPAEPVEQAVAAPAAVPAPVNAEGRAKFQAALNAAFDGSAPWLDALAKAAGYTRGLLVTTQQLAEIAGVTAPTVANWTTGGMPKLPGAGRRGAPSYDLAQVLPWLIEYYQGRIEKANAASRSGVEKAEQRKKSADAKLAEMKIAEKQNELLPREEVKQELTRLLQTFRERCMSIPSAMAALLAPETEEAKIQAILENEITAALGELAGYNPEKKEKGNVQTNGNCKRGSN